MANPKAYLIAATYNRIKWRGLTKARLDQAEKAAEVLFPDEEKSVPVSDLAGKGVLLASTYDSDLFGKVNSSYNSLETALREQVELVAKNIPTAVQDQIVEASIKSIPRKVRDLIVDGIYQTRPPKIPVGWMVVVDENHFSKYMEQMSGNDRQSGLWPVFDIEVFPLNAGWTNVDVLNMVPPLRNDRNTQEIYEFMTPTSWGR